MALKPGDPCEPPICDAPATVKVMLGDAACYWCREHAHRMAVGLAKWAADPTAYRSLSEILHGETEH